jgi:putative salt-induced outer membrane protein YdiY
MQAPKLLARLVVLLMLVASPWLAATSFAQTPAAPPPPPPKIWTVSASAGMAFTQGNTDTSSVNLGYNVTYDPQRKNVVKSEGLFLRSRSEGDLTANRLAFSGRDEYKLNARAYVFGQLQYLRDQFKEIEYLVAPTGGIGYKIVMLPRTELAVDGGAGVSWEKDTGVDLQTSGAVTFADKFTQKLSSNATFTQTFSALWKTQDFGDALYVTGLSLSAGVTTHTQLKVEFLDTYKHQPAVGVKPNDIALLFALVFKNN